MRVVALLAAYNEARFIQHTIRHLAAQGVESFLLDNDSTDGTLELARTLTGEGLIGWRRLPREGVFDWVPILAAKERLAQELTADWFIAQDCDEFRLPPEGFSGTLADALAAAEAEGFDAVDFHEFTFVPVAEAPDHDHDRFRETLRWFYRFAPQPLHRINAWKNRGQAVDLRSSGGHRVAFPGRRVAPAAGRLCHYLALSLPHAREKYARAHSSAEVARGWHGWRAHRPRGPLLLPPARALHEYRSDADLTSALPALGRHILGDLWEGRRPQPPRPAGWRWQLRLAVARMLWNGFGSRAWASSSGATTPEARGGQSPSTPAGAAETAASAGSEGRPSGVGSSAASGGRPALAGNRDTEPQRIPRILHWCWYGPQPLDTDHERCLASWQRHLPDWTIHRWDESNSPLAVDYCQRALAEQRWSRLTNYVRLWALTAHGGVYLDADVELCRPLDPLLDHGAFLGFQLRDEGPGWVNTAVLGATPGHPFLAECLELTLARFREHGEFPLSPHVTTAALRRRGLRHYGPQQLGDIALLGVEAFYPHSWLEPYDPHRITSDTYAVHLWKHSWAESE
jgi:hypothetical protein